MTAVHGQLDLPFCQCVDHPHRTLEQELNALGMPILLQICLVRQQKVANNGIQPIVNLRGGLSHGLRVRHTLDLFKLSNMANSLRIRQTITATMRGYLY